VSYEPKPDTRLVALILIGAIIVPSMVVAELTVPSLQPKLSQNPSSGPSSPPPTGGKVTGVKVNMPNGVSVNSKLNFQPSTIVVVIGVNNTVTWVNQDSADHSVTFTSGPSGVQLTAISNADVAPGDSFTVTFTTPGVYSYHCTFHPFWMIGKIIVKG
jgi:plastocyanin